MTELKQRNNERKTTMEEKPIGQALFISKETGEQIRFDLAAPIEPWPTPRPGGYVNDKPCQKFSGEFVIKSKNAPTFRQFQKLLKRRSKLPRKLKKAFKHLEHKEPRFEKIKMPNGIGAIVHMEIGPKEGYPHTKWIRKAVHLFRRRMTIMRKIRHQGTSSHMGYRNFFK